MQTYKYVAHCVDYSSGSATTLEIMGVVDSTSEYGAGLLVDAIQARAGRALLKRTVELVPGTNVATLPFKPNATRASVAPPVTPEPALADVTGFLPVKVSTPKVVTIT